MRFQSVPHTHMGSRDKLRQAGIINHANEHGEHYYVLRLVSRFLLPPPPPTTPLRVQWVIHCVWTTNVLEHSLPPTHYRVVARHGIADRQAL